MTKMESRCNYNYFGEKYGELLVNKFKNRWRKKERITDFIKWFEERYSFRIITMWLLFTLFMGFIFLYIENYVYSGRKLSPNIADGVILLYFFIINVLIFVLVADPHKALKIQKVHNLPSYVFYWYFGLLFTPIFSLFLSVLFRYSNLFPALNVLDQYFFVNLLLDSKIIYHFTQRALIIIVGIWVYIMLVKPKKISWDNERFSPGSVGLKGDKYDFSQKAKNEARGIQKLKNNVEVLMLRGEMGFGKSSYARMIVENLPIKDTLYSYISLTETNEAKDFSILFSERWSKTLASRYPKLDPIKIDMLRSITREFGYGFMSEIMNYFSNTNPGLEKTKTKAVDKELSFHREFIRKETAKLFGNIPNIFEKKWIFVVDEIERAPLSEIYRLIEIVERLKVEGRDGLPIKMIFLLCVADIDFKNILKNYFDKSYKARLVDDFFFVNSKTVTGRINLPPTPPDIWSRFIAEKIAFVMQKENIKWERTNL